jgi:hypothetical protein
LKSKKELSGDSITEAIVDVLEHGLPMNQQMRETHFELLRQAQADPQRQSFAVRGGKTLCLPLSAFGQRQLATGTPTLGAEWVGQQIQPGGLAICLAHFF